MWDLEYILNNFTLIWICFITYFIKTSLIGYLVHVNIYEDSIWKYTFVIINNIEIVI